MRVWCIGCLGKRFRRLRQFIRTMCIGLSTRYILWVLRLGDSTFVCLDHWQSFSIKGYLCSVPNIHVDDSDDRHDCRVLVGLHLYPRRIYTTNVGPRTLFETPHQLTISARYGSIRACCASTTELYDFNAIGIQWGDCKSPLLQIFLK